MARRQSANLSSIVKTITDTNMAEPIADVQIFVTEFYAWFNDGNANVMYLGDPTVESTKWIPHNPDSATNYNTDHIPGEETHFDLARMYVYGTAGESVRIEYKENK